LIVSPWMIIDIFSNFDPIWFDLCYKNFIFIVLIPIIFMRPFWLKQRKIILSLLPLISYIYYQLIRTKTKFLKTSPLIKCVIFILIIYINILGIVPYIFRTTRHILFTASIGFPVWILLIARTILYSTKNSIAHLLPDSSPMWLRPFLVLIESSRILVRPITLRFRLAANITAGHVIINLIISFSITHKIKPFITMCLASRIYIIFELLICFIQAYIFCLLLSLYSNDHE